MNDGAFTEYVWGDVLKGIENFLHNVTAGLLTLQLGTMKAVCFCDEKIVVYQLFINILPLRFGCHTELVFL